MASGGNHVILRGIRMLASLACVVLLTWIAKRFVAVNATTIGFGYLLLVLAIATRWGVLEAFLASLAATFAFNFFFLPPVGTLTIADPQNWVALFSFLVTALVASHLSTEAKRRALEADARQRDVERLYTFSRAILLIDKGESFPKQLVRKLAEIFELEAVVLFERRTEEFHRAGPSDFEGLDDQLRQGALQGTSFADPEQQKTITAVRLGSEPIGALALQGKQMPDSVLQGISNLAAIGLERARTQNLESQVEAARRSEKLRTTLLDAMAHEFKTPLTSVLAATSALLNDPDQAFENRMELLRIADEEGRRLKELIGDTVDMARLDGADIRIQPELTNMEEMAHEVVRAMRLEIDDRPVRVMCEGRPPAIPVDRRLVGLAIRQLLNNALKYSPPEKPITLNVHNGDGMVAIDVTDHGPGIAAQEQSRIFERMYRSPSVEKKIPGSGLGLSIAQSIARAHRGDLRVTSRPGETIFRLTLPAKRERDGR
jgi:two-component system sensor histidine kinase KdpD